MQTGGERILQHGAVGGPNPFVDRNGVGFIGLEIPAKDDLPVFALDRDTGLWLDRHMTGDFRQFDGGRQP